MSIEDEIPEKKILFFEYEIDKNYNNNTNNIRKNLIKVDSFIFFYKKKIGSLTHN